MFDLSLGSVHRSDTVSGYVYATRPDDPGRDGIVVLEIWPQHGTFESRHQKTPLHVFEMGFRVTELFEYQKPPLSLTLGQLKTNLWPIVRMHFEVQILLHQQTKPWEMRLAEIRWR